MPDNSRFLESPSKIFLRNCYEDLYHLILEEKGRNILITGNPGVGKSYFSLYVMYRLLCEKKDCKIWYESISFNRWILITNTELTDLLAIISSAIHALGYCQAKLIQPPRPATYVCTHAHTTLTSAVPVQMLVCSIWSHTSVPSASDHPWNLAYSVHFICLLLLLIFVCIVSIML